MQERADAARYPWMGEQRELMGWTWAVGPPDPSLSRDDWRWVRAISPSHGRPWPLFKASKEVAELVVREHNDALEGARTLDSLGRLMEAPDGCDSPARVPYGCTEHARTFKVTMVFQVGWRAVWALVRNGRTLVTASQVCFTDDLKRAAHLGGMVGAGSGREG